MSISDKQVNKMADSLPKISDSKQSSFSFSIKNILNDNKPAKTEASSSLGPHNKTKSKSYRQKSTIEKPLNKGTNDEDSSESNSKNWLESSQSNQDDEIDENETTSEINIDDMDEENDDNEDNVDADDFDNENDNGDEDEDQKYPKDYEEFYDENNETNSAHSNEVNGNF